MEFVYNNLLGVDNALKKLNKCYILFNCREKKGLFLHARLFRPPCLSLGSY